MNITVYLGALEGNDPALGDAVRELGTWIGESGNSLVYGGSKSGLMGQIAESVLNAGGKVTGVEPQFFIDSELQYDEITELIVTKDMAERKAKMIVDLFMISLLPLLMAYSLVGEAAHEWIGTEIFLLFILHHILNRKWTAHMFKGKYTKFRILQTILGAGICSTDLQSPVC